MADKSKDETFEAEIRAQFADAQNVRPETIAAAFKLANAKGIRGFLRATFPRPVELKNSSWLLTNEQTIAVVDHLLARRAANAPKD